MALKIREICFVHFKVCNTQMDVFCSEIGKRFDSSLCCYKKTKLQFHIFCPSEENTIMF